MADKGWMTQVATAAGTAAGTGAAQLGLGYGLGVIVWPEADADSVWLGSLGWATWIAASATVLGAVIAARLGPDGPGRWRGPWRFALAASAALGALVSVALVALPARSAVRADTFSPQVIAAGYALIGVLAGILVAYWAVMSGPVAANLLGTAAWLWALAITGVVADLTSRRSSANYLTSWHFTESLDPVRYGGIHWPSASLTLAAAFLIGLLSVWPAARHGDLGLGAATSGAVGPLLVAISFLALAPRMTDTLGPLQSAYLIAPYAVLAGLAGSALTVSAAQGRRNRRDRAAGPDPESNAEARSSAAPALAGAPQAQPGAAQDEPVAFPAVPKQPPAPRDDRSEGSARREGRGEGIAPQEGRSDSSAPREGRSDGSATREGLGEGVAPASRPTGRTPAEHTGAAEPGTRRPPAQQAGAIEPGTRRPPAPAGAADPEIAAAARPTKRGAPRKPGNGAPRPTITPPPEQPTIARINPPEQEKR